MIRNTSQKELDANDYFVDVSGQKNFLRHQEVIVVEPDILAYRKAYARFLIGLNQVDEAGAVLRLAVKDFPEEQSAKLAYIEFLSGTQGVDKAIDELRLMIANEPDERRYQFALGKVYEASNQRDEAVALYEGLINALAPDSPDLIGAKVRLAVLKTQLQDLPAARVLVDEVLKESSRNPEALTLRGTLLLNNGDTSGAIADLRTVLRDEPRRITAVRLLARAHQTNKESDLAGEVLKEGLKNNPEATAIALDLANFHIARDDVLKALSILDGVLERNPNDIAALEGKFKLLVSQRRFGAGAEVAEQLKTVDPQGVKGYHFAGLVRQAEGEFEASIGEFQSALDISPQAVQPLAQMVKSYVAMKRPEDAIAKLKEVITGMAAHFVARNLLGELYLADAQRELAETEFKTALELSPGWPIPYRNLASLYIASERESEALTLMKQGVEATNGAPLLVTSLAGYLEKTGQLDAAMSEYEQVLAEKPESALAANNLAMLLIEYRQDEASWKRARALAVPLRNTTNAAYLDSVGWVEYKLGAFEQAVLFLQQAVERAPDANLMYYHLGMAHHRLGNGGAARKHLSRALEGNVEFQGIEEARKTLEDL